MDWPIIITVILVVGIGGLVVAKWWFRLSSRFHRYEDEQDPRTAHKNNQPDNEVVIHWDDASASPPTHEQTNTASR